VIDFLKWTWFDSHDAAIDRFDVGWLQAGQRTIAKDSRHPKIRFEVLPMPDDRDDVRKQMAELSERYGEWTAMGIQLRDGLSTLEPIIFDRGLFRVVQSAADLPKKPLAESRVLDLACLKGHYAIEFALQGAEAVGIEEREANIMKARFAKETLGLSRLTFLQGDVCTLSREQHGDFDIVICSGILYHLNAPDVFHFLKRIAEVCHGIVIIDTFFSVKDKISFEFEGRTYWGRYCPEHDPDTDKTQRMKALWSSMDNVQSVWLTRPWLFNLLEHVGFTSVLECCVPSMLNLPFDRATIVAVKNKRVPSLSSPPTDSLETEAWPEHRPFKVHAIQDPKSIAFQRIKSLLPNVIKVPLKNVRAMLKRKVTTKPAGPWEWTQPWMHR
jgi:2-polyprenyl-3-methyl-5-hydroxy-6-metoxy-1,4-benzoquinol methylase